MIHNLDRSKWFGASDTNKIMGNWNTISFTSWWAEKLGLYSRSFTTKAMRAGTAYEHKILKSLGITKMDRQIKKRSLRLRVNLDGETQNLVIEVKTHKSPEFKIIKSYWQQCQVEMYITGKKCFIAAYRMVEEEYENYFLPVEQSRISIHPIEYNPEWIKTEYIPRLKYLAKCLRRRKVPDETNFSKCQMDGR